MTFNDLFLEYIDLLGSLQSNKEVINKKSRYENHIAPIIGNLEIEDIKYKHCQEIVNNAIQVKELTPKTAKNINAIVQTVFNYAIRNEYTLRNPASKVIIPKYDNKYNIDLSKEQIQDLIDCIYTTENQTHKDIFIFALHGRRKEEILSLQWSQIDFSLNQYHIPPQKNKARKHDIHTMTSRIREVLLARYNEAKKEINFSNSDYVFRSAQTNTKYSDFKRPFQKLRQRAGIGLNFRFHDFRHLLATYTINQKGLSIEFVSYALGHSTIEVTQKYITKDSTISALVVDSFLDDFLGVNQ